MPSDEVILDMSQEPEFCPKCNYVQGEYCCEKSKEIEREKAEKERAIQAASLGGKRQAREYTSSGFDVSLQPKKLQGKYQEALDAVNNFDSTKDNIFLYGAPGSGKSHLGTIAIRHSHPSSRFVLAGSSFSGELMKAKLDGAPLPFMQYRALMLDDIDKCSVKEFGAAEIQRWINNWYSQDRGGLVITSNKDLGQLAEAWQDDSICSRIAGMCKIYGFSDAKDVRLLRRDK